MMDGPCQIHKNRDYETLARANRAWVRTLSRPGPDSSAAVPPDFKLKPIPVQALRAHADRAALWLRYHDPVCHRALLPKDLGQRLLLTVLERGRVWAAGSMVFPGVGRNLAWHMAQPLPSLSLSRKLETLAFVELAKNRLPHFRVQGGGFCETPFHALSDLLKSLVGFLEDQEAFGREVLAFLDAWPETDTLVKHLAAEADGVDPDTKLMLPEAVFQQETQPDREEGPISPEDKKEAVSHRTGMDFDDGYRAYTTSFDQAVPAETLFSPEEKARYARQLEQGSLSYRRTVTRLARRLMRQIMAWQRRSWVFDQDEGVVDPRRLAGLAADPMNHRIFMQESESPFPATAVSLLIDNSGSMKGRPIQMAAMTVKVLAEALERCRIKTEILGYTTRTWNGGRAREKWCRAGSPPRPGRLNELRHIVYKAADDPWRRARHNLGIMLHPELLRENIDGEALLWAWKRFLKRPEPRRILLVICDGDPHDEATLSANGQDYLVRHLRSVIARIERSPVELTSIGIGQPVGRFYSQAVFLEKLTDLPERLSQQLLRLLYPSPGQPFGVSK